MVLVVVALAVALVGVLVALVVSVVKGTAERKRFAAIVDVDAEIARLRAAASREVAQLRSAAEVEIAESHKDAQRQQREAQASIGAAQAEAARLTAVAAQEAQRLQREAQASVGAARAEAARLTAAAAAEAESVRRANAAERDRQLQLASESARARGDLERLQDELRKVEGSLEDISFGLYQPHYRFDTPEQFKAELDRVFARQKDMVRAGKAATFGVSWTINNDKREGERMQKQYCKLLLRAFNGECDAAIAKVAWNNASKMEERIRRAFDAINKLGEVMKVSLSPAYRELKLAELRLEHELAEKKHEIAEEQRRIREQMKDEQKALHEAEKAQAEAEAEEVRFQKALDKAKLELAKARGEEHARLNEKIIELQQQLSEAKAKSVRAKSLAEMTRAGYVYIISNIGSFGEQVFKIGMTRRLDPMDRVRELAAASVPFPFDVHAMVYSDDAPGLEAAFHQHFKDRSVNLVNMRKEFFNVDIAELEAFAKKRGLKIAFTKLAEAREYRESAAMRLARGSGPTTVPKTAEERVAVESALAKYSSKPDEHPRRPRSHVTPGADPAQEN